MKQTAHKLMKIFRSNTICVLLCLSILQIAITMTLQAKTMLVLDEKFSKIDQDLYEIDIKLDAIAASTDFIQDDISELSLMLNQMKDVEEKEEKEEAVEIYGEKDKDEIVGMIFEIAPQYDISPFMLMAMIERESNYQPNATNGQYKGLLQISERWHGSRMKELGVSDLYDPAGNIAVACSYLKDLYDLYEDQELVLMCYSMDNSKAMDLWRKGQVSVYATAVIDRMRELEEGHGED